MQYRRSYFSSYYRFGIILSANKLTDMHRKATRRWFSEMATARGKTLAFLCPCKDTKAGLSDEGEILRAEAEGSRRNAKPSLGSSGTDGWRDREKAGV